MRDVFFNFFFYLLYVCTRPSSYRVFTITITTIIIIFFVSPPDCRWFEIYCHRRAAAAAAYVPVIILCACRRVVQCSVSAVCAFRRFDIVTVRVAVRPPAYFTRFFFASVCVRVRVRLRIVTPIASENIPKIAFHRRETRAGVKSVPPTRACVNININRCVISYRYPVF